MCFQSTTVPGRLQQERVFVAIFAAQVVFCYSARCSSQWINRTHHKMSNIFNTNVRYDSDYFVFVQPIINNMII